jgi:hypothetical protein
MNDKVVGGARSTKGRGELLLPCSLVIPAKILKVTRTHIIHRKERLTRFELDTR